MTKRMRKILALALGLVLLLTMAACGNEGGGAQQPGPSSGTQTDVQGEKTAEASAMQYVSGYVEKSIAAGKGYSNGMTMKDDILYMMLVEYPSYEEPVAATPSEEETGDEPAGSDEPAEDEDEKDNKDDKKAEDEPEDNPDEPAKTPEFDYSGPIYKLISIKGGEKVEERKLNVSSSMNFYNIAIAPDGEPVFLLQDNSAYDEFYENMPEGYEPTQEDYDELQRQTRMKFMKEKDGEFQPIGEGISGDDYVEAFAILSDGSIVAASYNGLTLLDSEGKQLRTFGTNTRGVCVVNDLIYTMVEWNSVAAYDPATGEEKSKIMMPGAEDTNRRYFNYFAVDKNGAIYLADENGVIRNKGGEGDDWEEIVDGVSSVFGSGEFYTQGFFVDSNGDIYVNTQAEYREGQEGDSATVFYYTWSDEIPYGGSELNIVSAGSFSQIRAAANRFQRAHPEIKVNYRAYGSNEGMPTYFSYMSPSNLDWIKESTVAQDDAVRAINTELLSGNAPDVVILDGMPMDSYIEKGYLMDLTEWMNGRESDGTWVSNFATAFKQEDGSIPCIPSAGLIPLLWGEKGDLDNIKTVHELAAVAKAMGEDEHLWMSYSNSSIVSLFYPLCQDDWKNERGIIDFSTPAFREYLEDCKAMQETMREEPDWENMQNDDYVKYDMDIWTSLLDGTTRYYFEWLTNYGGFETGNAVMKKRGGEPVAIPLPSQSGATSFIPTQIVGISKDAKNTLLAKEFLDLLLSSEMQMNSYRINGIPTNMEAFEKTIEVPKIEYDADGNPLEYGRGAMGVGDGSIEIEFENVTQEMHDKIKALVGSADTVVIPDMTLVLMVYEETIGYFEGSKSIDETVSALNARARTYLME